MEEEKLRVANDRAIDPSVETTSFYYARKAASLNSSRAV